MVKSRLRGTARLLAGEHPEVWVDRAMRELQAEPHASNLTTLAHGCTLLRRRRCLIDACRWHALASPWPYPGVYAELRLFLEWEEGDDAAVVGSCLSAVKGGHAIGAGLSLALMVHMIDRCKPGLVPAELKRRVVARVPGPLTGATVTDVLSSFLRGEASLEAVRQAAHATGECVWQRVAEILTVVERSNKPVDGLRRLPWADWLTPGGDGQPAEQINATIRHAVVLLGFVTMRRGLPLAEGTVWPVDMVPPEVAAAVQARTKKRAAVRGVNLARKKAGPRSVARKTAKKVAVKRKASRRRAKKKR